MGPEMTDTKRIRLYVHRDKDSNYDVAQQLGFKVGSKAERMFLYACSEVELIVDVNMKTGETTVVGAEGKFLGEEKVTPGEVEL